MKPGPIVAMAVILGMSLWIMLATSPSVKATDGAAQIELVVANKKLKVEMRRAADQPSRYEYRFRNWPEKGADWISDEKFEAIIDESADNSGRSWLLQVCNVTSPLNLAWVALGLGGQLVFSARLIVQWLASEKERKSVVPAAFWYLSLGGGLCLTTYFLWRHDLVGVLGQSMGLVVYVRNIRLILLHKQGV
jgi:lipid-A-disaccharide synthase-like uncharacterized protein